MALIFLFLVVAIRILRYFEKGMHLIALVDVVRFLNLAYDEVAIPCLTTGVVLGKSPAP